MGSCSSQKKQYQRSQTSTSNNYSSSYRGCSSVVVDKYINKRQMEDVNQTKLNLESQNQKQGENPIQQCQQQQNHYSLQQTNENIYNQQREQNFQNEKACIQENQKQFHSQQFNQLNNQDQPNDQQNKSQVQFVNQQYYIEMQQINNQLNQQHSQHQNQAYYQNLQPYYQQNQNYFQYQVQNQQQILYQQHQYCLQYQNPFIAQHNPPYYNYQLQNQFGYFYPQYDQNIYSQQQQSTIQQSNQEIYNNNDQIYEQQNGQNNQLESQQCQDLQNPKQKSCKAKLFKKYSQRNKKSQSQQHQNNSKLVFAPWVWPNGIIPYIIDGSFTFRMRKYLYYSIQEFEKKTPIRFQLLSDPTTCNGSYVKYYKSLNDQSFTLNAGRLTKEIAQAKKISNYLENPVFLNELAPYGTYLHETMHILGFLHEQCRQDRDNYVCIKDFGENPEISYQYLKMGYMIGDYDLQSVMHYPLNEKMQLKSQSIIKNSHFKIGQRLKLSDGDVKAIQLIYGNSQCTYDVGLPNQTYFRCITCENKENDFQVCETCSLICHKGHNLIFQNNRSEQCKCGFYKHKNQRKYNPFQWQFQDKKL